jgi:hypothetical protein
MRKVTFSVPIPQMSDLSSLCRDAYRFCFDPRYHFAVAIPDNLEVVEVKRIPYERALDGIDAVESEHVIAQAIQSWIGHNGLDCPASLVLPVEQFPLRTVKYGAQPGEMASIAHTAALYTISQDLRDVEWRWLIRDYDDELRRVRKFILTWTSKKRVEQAIQPFRCERVGRRLDCVTSRALTMLDYQAAYCDFPQDQQAHVILDMHSRTTDIHITTNESSWVRLIHTGGRSFTRALMGVYGYDFAQAEDHKLHVTQWEDPRKAFGAMGSEYELLCIEIARAIKCYSDSHPKVTLTSVALTGKAASLPGLSRVLASKLSMEVAPLTPSERIRIPNPIQQKFVGDEFPNLLHPYVAAVQRLGFGYFRENFLPRGAPFRKRAKMAWGVDVGTLGLSAVKVRLVR